MKILIATDTYLPSVNGVVSFIQTLTISLRQKGHQVYIIAPSSTINDSKYTTDDGIVVFGIRSVPIKAYPNLRVAPPLIAKRAIKKIMEEVKPEIVHIQDHFTLGREVFQIAQSLNLPVIGTNHFLPENFIHYVPLVKLTKRPIVKLTWNQFLRTYNHLDIITTPTQTAAWLMKEAGIQKKIIPVSNGVDLITFNPENNGDYLKKRYNIPDKKIMLFVGRLDKEKRIEVILKSLPLILKKIDVHFVLGGIGVQKSRLEDLIDKLNLKNNVTLTGFVPAKDLANLYAIADVFVVACIAELQSIATMEAMASGLPVVAVEAKALPELVHDDKNGYLFPIDNHHKLAEGVIKIISNPELEQRMRKESLRIISHHDINVTISKYEKLYLKTIQDYVKTTPKTESHSKRINKYLKKSLKTAKTFIDTMND